jgi:fatty acid desaturase
MSSRYFLDEVAKHCTENDCWVIIDGDVLDVTEFLRQHPGGVSVICKPGRAGKDVTAHFEKIGHSASARATLATLKIGVVDTESELPSDESLPLLRTLDAEKTLNHEYAIRWHAARRQAIIKDHPEIAALVGSNPWTCVIGAATVLLHCYICIFVQAENCPWYMAFILAYTVGAVLKMYQFAINHDICHDTAGSFLKQHGWMKRCAMQVFTLPGIAGSMHTYYEFQHIGHHTCLGAQGLADLDPTRSSAQDSDAAWRRMIFFPEGDGDLFALGTLALGRVVQSWRGGEQRGSGGEDRAEMGQNSQEPEYLREYFGGDVLQYYHNNHKLLKCLVVQLFHVQHHLAMTIMFLNSLLVIPPVSIPLVLWPEKAVSLMLGFMRRWPEPVTESSSTTGLTSAARELVMSMSVIILGKSMQCLVVLQSIRAVSESVCHFAGVDNRCSMINVVCVGSVGLHTWLWVMLDMWLVAGHNDVTWTSVFKGLLYLYISDLCLYGFAMHPFMGYFLGVHRSGGDGFSSSSNRTTQTCQPTMSTYSLCASLASMNLTHHVEHHDFPGIPWNRLPEVTRIAPEYYSSLESSSGFCNTIYQWFHHSGSWGYACQ